MNNNIFHFMVIIIIKYIIYIKRGVTPALERLCESTITVAMYATFIITFSSIVNKYLSYRNCYNIIIYKKSCINCTDTNVD